MSTEVYYDVETQKSASEVGGWSNVDKMLAFYDDSKKTIVVESRGNIRNGVAEVRKMYEEAFNEVTFERVSLTPTVLQRKGPVAWATCRYKANTRLKSDNSRYILELRASFVMKREEDTWQITLEHFSTIAGVPRLRRAE